MKITILSQGDRSVGIPDGEWIVEEVGMSLPITEAERALKRADYRFAFADMIDGPFGVFFEDECVDCRHILVNGKCVNPHCICNINEDREIEADGECLLDSPEN